MADLSAGEASVAGESPQATTFDRDTAVWREQGTGKTAFNGSNGAREAVFGAEVSPDWRAGRGPHGGYLAAILLRALIESVGARDGADAGATREPRSLTIHYARAPEPGPVRISTVLEREGRSLSTFSARMHQGEELVALVLAAFSLPWGGAEISEAQMPSVEPADPSRDSVLLMEQGAPVFARHLVLQPRLGGVPFADTERPMEVGGWLGLAEPRPIDALSLAFFSDALIPAPYMRLSEPAAVPTVDLTVHFRARTRPAAQADPRELCLAQTRTELIHDGFFVEDGLIWAADGALLAHSRQLAIVIPLHAR